MRLRFLSFSLTVIALTGCAAIPGVDCSKTTTTYTVSPTSVTLDHLASAPGNQQKFTATRSTSYPSGCAVPAFVLAPNQDDWASSDPVNAPVSTVHDATNGTVTCVGATTGSAILTAKLMGSTATATVVCK